MSAQGTPSSEDLDETALEDLIRGFLSKYKFLHEYRLQKLIYFAELFATESKDSRLTEADFKPFMYGAYSEDVSEKLEEMESEPDVATKTDMHHGKTVTAYLGQDIDESDVDPDAMDIISQVHPSTQSESNEDLAQASKQSWLYQETPYSSEMDFDEYREKLDDGEINSDIDRFFPDLDIDTDTTD
ncbi:type II toxin-antitoxin system antitoxin SocA domain-containing protein [Halorubrum distributum]|uniref:Antitoxin SocA-like Panacea domain-containing protein n=1 Tax=Halorubrum distributum JCM 10247 TaxID=1227486 RepID=M0DI59_9EURY|nr:type II toxin-antitoxin system antitoxin SocA domain-containing protein [Halorubrum terrestre]ELZ35186.1 hypothetical protein C473_04449 [Halorubrum terrestre JCM 10247]